MAALPRGAWERFVVERGHDLRWSVDTIYGGAWVRFTVDICRKKRGTSSFWNYSPLFFERL